LPGTLSDVGEKVSVAAQRPLITPFKYLLCIQTQAFGVGRSILVQRAFSTVLEGRRQRINCGLSNFLNALVLPMGLAWALLETCVSVLLVTVRENQLTLKRRRQNVVDNLRRASHSVVTRFRDELHFGRVHTPSARPRARPSGDKSSERAQGGLRDKRTKRAKKGASRFCTTPLFFFHRLFDEKAANRTRSITGLLLDARLTRAAIWTPLRVERAAGGATIVHCSREPIRDERAYEQDCDEDKDAQQRVLQALCLSSISWW
jgi:hypothetical protein